MKQLKHFLTFNYQFVHSQIKFKEILLLLKKGLIVYDKKNCLPI